LAFGRKVNKKITKLLTWLIFHLGGKKTKLLTWLVFHFGGKQNQVINLVDFPFRWKKNQVKPSLSRGIISIVY
jgi:hypothetical protein